MVLLGGLEIVVGGYFIHRYHKNKNEKKRMEEDAQRRRHNTFPGAKPHWYPEQQQHQQHQQQPMMPQQKYACYAPQPRPQQPQFQPRPHSAQPPPHLQHQPQSFTIPRRPVPQQQPHWQQQIQPLQRADSMATLSRMPIANGSRYRETNPALPPRPNLLHVQTLPQQGPNHPYSNTGFSVSAPSFEHFSTSPGAHPSHQPGRGHTVDDNWETYGQLSPHVHFAPSVSTQLGEEGEDDPPPPYRA